VEQAGIVSCKRAGRWNHEAGFPTWMGTRLGAEHLRTADAKKRSEWRLNALEFPKLRALRRRANQTQHITDPCSVRHTCYTPPADRSHPDALPSRERRPASAVLKDSRLAAGRPSLNNILCQRRVDAGNCRTVMRAARRERPSNHPRREADGMSRSCPSWMRGWHDSGTTCPGAGYCFVRYTDTPREARRTTRTAL
jgi:hypothetical protein